MNTLRYILYRIKWHLAPYINFSAPVHLDIELNNNCNQRCLSCWHSKPLELPFTINQMDIETCKNLLLQARTLGAMSVKFNLRGEPFLYRHLNDAIKYARDLGYADIMLNTNGTAHYYQLYEAIKYGVTTLIISVDSVDCKTYMKIHGAPERDYIKLFANLDDLRGLAYISRIKLNVHINKCNKDEDFSYLERKYPMYEIVYRNTEKRKGKDISIGKDTKRKRVKCPHIHRRLTITANGNIFPCCVCYEEPQDILIGSTDNSLDFVWNKSRNIILDRHNTGKLPKTCKECTSGDVWK